MKTTICPLFILALISFCAHVPAAAQPDSTVDSRPLEPAPRSNWPQGERWAVIIGISKYQNAGIRSLEYAHRDADSLYHLLQRPSGGGFKKDHIVHLTDSTATYANIRFALRSFLKQPKEGDLVLLYFACHGAPDRDRPANETVYLLPYDTDPNHLAATAIPMREIDEALREILLARQVIILADACHSANIAGGIGGRNLENNKAVNKSLKGLGDAKGGIALLSSASANEEAQEDRRWGGGHGVFTHFLLEGLRGRADDTPQDGQVSVGELFEYVRANVIEATKNQPKKQTPVIGPNAFDRAFPLAITGGLKAREHYELGRQLYQLGLMLDDAGRFGAAIRQYDEALRVTPEAFHEARLERGRAFLAQGQPDRAIDELKKVKALPEVNFLLGRAYARKKDYRAAAPALKTFLREQGRDHRAAWAKEYVNWMAEKAAGKKLALLIGIADYPAASSLAKLKGPLNDIDLMEKILTQKFGFKKEQTVMVLEAAATRSGILKAFENLSQAATLNDTIFVYYSGWASTDSALFPYDVVTDSTRRQNIISARELHHLFHALPATHKTIVLDTNPMSKLLALARKEPGYALFTAASPGQMAYENNIFEGKWAGVFTYALVEQLRKANPKTFTYGQVADSVSKKLQGVSPAQTPVYVGERERLFFTGNGEDYFLGIFDFAERRSYICYTKEFIQARYQWFSRKFAATPYPQALYSFGRALWEKNDYPQAVQALQTALRQRQGNYPEAQFALSLLQARMQNYAEALSGFEKYFTALNSPALQNQMQAPLALLKTLKQSDKHALLVGVEALSLATNPDLNVTQTAMASSASDARAPILPLQGPKNDVHALKNILIEKYGFQAANVKVLLNEQATRPAILQNFAELAQKTRWDAGLFYFSGYGSQTAAGMPAIVSVDGRQGGILDLTLEELAALAARQKSNLTAIIDAGCSFSASRGNRSLPPDPRPAANGESRQNAGAKAGQIGEISIYPGTMSNARQPEIFDLEFEYESEGAQRKFHGELTFSLIQSLQRAGSDSFTYAQLYEAAVAKIVKPSLPPAIFGENLNRKLFGAQPALADSLHKLATAIARSEQIEGAVASLQRLIEQRKGNYVEGYLNLGVAYAAKGEYDQSIQELEIALSQLGNTPNPDVHYHLGRVLLERRKNLEKAAGELRLAIEQDALNIPAHYYFGKTIRALIEQDLLAEAEKSLQLYLEKGAPLGFDDEVEVFLRSRKAAITTGSR